MISSVVMTLFSPLSAYASLSPADYVGQGIDHYDTRMPCGGGGGSLSGANNIEKIFNYFIGKGLSVAATSGILGNIQTESGFNPFRLQGTYSDINEVLPPEAHSRYERAWGLVQWDGGRRQQILTRALGKWPDFVTTVNTYGQTADGSNGVPQNDAYLSFELDYVWEELSGPYSGALSALQGVANSEDGARQASVIWDEQYEISSGDAASERASQGAAFFTQFNGSGPGGSSVPTSGGSPVGTSTGLCTPGQPAGSVVYYSQLDPEWKDSPYGGTGPLDTIAYSGCGPTSMAMILATLVDKSITPPDVAAVAGEQHGGTSSHQNLIDGVSAKWPVTITVAMSLDDAIAFVQSGKGLVWMGGQGAPPFTQSGHLVAMVGVTSDGKITIADPIGDGSDSSGQLHAKIKDYTKAEIQAGMGSAYGVSKR